MDKDYLSFVIVGHIDHGKSTLIGRLLYDSNSLPKEKIEEIKKTCEMLGKPFEFAYVMDHLDEEREKNITIETSQIFFKNGEKNYVIIDAPGHKEFIKNMLTGASQADAAVVIVDAHEGVREQTRRHLYLLSMLGIGQVIAVLNKMDKVEYRQLKFEEVKKELEEFLSDVGIEASQIIPISAMNGDNVIKKSVRMEWYEGSTVLEALSTFKNRLDLSEKPLRFPVQDVYEMNGKKRYVGRLESGVIKEGMKVKILPRNEEAEIKTIENFGLDINKAEAGKSTGITLSNNVECERGEMVCTGALPFSREEIKASIFWMGTKPLNKNEKIICKCTTQEVECAVKEIFKRMDSSTLKLLDSSEEKIGGLEAAEVLLRFKNKIVVDDFSEIATTGRFVLIREGVVQGGGIVRE